MTRRRSSLFKQDQETAQQDPFGPGMQCLLSLGKLDGRSIHQPRTAIECREGKQANFRRFISPPHRYTSAWAEKVQ